MIRTKRSSVPPGFKAHAFDDPALEFFDILLPAVVAEELAQKREALAMSSTASAGASGTKTPPAPSHTAKALDPDKEEMKIAVWRPGRDYDPLRLHKVYDDREPVKLLRSAQGYADKRDQDRLADQFKQLRPRGPLRVIKRAPDAEELVDALGASQPHFADVVKFVKAHLLAADQTERPQRLPPILLLGEPGVGKTHFAFELARCLGTTIVRHSFDNAQSTSTFLGSDRHWGNTHYGLVYETIALGDCANPVILLDELDKPTRHSGVDPAAPLHSLLEPVSACAVRDSSLDFQMDASLITWIATANDRSRIPTSLLSRFRTFDIQCPSGSQAIELARSVIAGTLRTLGVAPSPSTRRLPVMLAHLTPREIRQACEDAVANCASAGRHDLHLQDFRAFVEGDQGRQVWLH